ncbi:hypothetical protein BZP36_21065 [Raoultella terrigena]|nr:hypothetical protein BZP36_21065 [Raoultella terrigena]
MAQSGLPCLIVVQAGRNIRKVTGCFLHNQAARGCGLAQRRHRPRSGIINAYLFPGLPQSEYNRRRRP